MTTTDIEYTEVLASFTFRDITEKVVIGHNPKTDTWTMRYLRPGQTWDCAQATLDDVESREEIIKRAKRFMIGHGKCLVQNVIQSWEEGWR